MSKENKLLTAFTTFMLGHGIECVEDIYQNDTVDEDSLSLIEDLFNIVDIHNKCENKQTNADKIRAMSDEELAELQFDKSICNNCFVKCNDKDNCPSLSSCYSRHLDWLQSEAE